MGGFIALSDFCQKLSINKLFLVVLDDLFYTKDKLVHNLLFTSTILYVCIYKLDFNRHLMSSIHTQNNNILPLRFRSKVFNMKDIVAYMNHRYKSYVLNFQSQFIRYLKNRNLVEYLCMNVWRNSWSILQNEFSQSQHGLFSRALPMTWN